MLNSVIVPYFPSSVDHQPNLFSPEERAVEVLASHVVSTKRPLSINSLHTMDYGLDVMTRCQKEGKTLLCGFGEGGLCTDCEEMCVFDLSNCCLVALHVVLGFDQMLDKSRTLYYQSKQLEERLLSLRENAKGLQSHAPNVNST